MNDRSTADNAIALLAYLRRLPEPRAALDTLATQLALERAPLFAALAQLREWGYRIKDDDGSAHLVASPDRLIDTEISFGLGTRFIGQVMHTYQSVRSTNDLAHSLAESGAAEGTIVTAEEQTKGRGRHGRTWHSPSGSGIYLSIILRPNLTSEKMPGLSLVTALALAETINDYCPERVQVKWPNDVLISGRKTAGILTELFADRTSLHHVIVGVGINVHQKPAELPDELRTATTSVGVESRFPVRRVELLQKFLRQFEIDYRDFCTDELARALPRLRGMSSLIGREVAIEQRGELVHGRALDIDRSGRLVVEVDGVKQAVVSGEVRVRAVE